MKNSTVLGKSRYFRPKKGTEAEYTFFPSRAFKASHDREDDDVGFFLRHNEVLRLDPTKPSIRKAGVETIYVQEGKVTISFAAWDSLDETSLKPLLADRRVEIHSIENIIREYLTD